MNDISHGDAVTLDPENPWLGLFSYSEETRAYFHGRDEEAAELARRVQRKLLTVLFGQSGLGKTSLLRAGLVPRLRGADFCPVYVRIDYAPESPSPSEQIKQAIFRATAEAGHWTRPGSAIEGESLWEFLHHREDLLRDANGHTLMPLLIFDQFEEIFTLGQADDAGRLRAKQFLEDLADLVENRPPAALEKRLDEDDEAAAQFDFARADYRVLIALREDYLAHLESVKDIMPSITQNRMRLARMNGAQALSAVVKPGGNLVSQEVAEAIVRFVAGGSELANAEIEPSLLSLVCRELNSTRQAQGRREISADLLAGSRDTILSEFYERALADQPTGVRRVIEDELLTESGYRESLAEERVRKALDAAGASSDALPTLVNRRLLRIEERLDMRRVELTHDVLCSVVLASRNQRHAREAREEAERQLADQREREAATHRALLRTRMVATVCVVLLVLAIIAATFGFIGMHRAKIAEMEAQKSRSDAEKLVSFLIEDFYTELAPTGRLETLGRLANMTVGYYDSLPPELVTKQTQAFRAMALLREGQALFGSGDTKDAYAHFDEGESIFRTLQAAGDHGEATSYGLALALYYQGQGVVVGGGSGRGTAKQLKDAANLLRPFAYAPDASRRVRQLYAQDLDYLSHALPPAQGVAICDEARKVLAGLGALNLADLDAASEYADTADSEARELVTLGQYEQAQQLEQQVYELVEKIIARRPGDLHAMQDRAWAAGLLSDLARYRHDEVARAEFARRAEQAGQDEVRFNSSDLSAWWRWSLGFQFIAEDQFDRGEVAQSIATRRQLLSLEQDKRLPSSLARSVWYQWIELAREQAETGDMVAAAQSFKGYKYDIAQFRATLAADDPRRKLLAEGPAVLEAQMQLVQGDARSALASATKATLRIASIESSRDDVNSRIAQNRMLSAGLYLASEAAVRLGRHAQAEALARRLLDIPPDPTNGAADSQNQKSEVQIILARALAGLGRLGEARAALQPALEWYRKQLAAGAYETQFREDFAYALYVDAIAQQPDSVGRKQRAADLDQAEKLIAGASIEAQKMAGMRYTAGLVTKARTATQI
jgi:hypothetical protein